MEFDPFKDGGAVAVQDEEPFDPFKSGATPVDASASPTPETDKAVAATGGLVKELAKPARSIAKSAKDFVLGIPQAIAQTGKFMADPVKTVTEALPGTVGLMDKFRKSKPFSQEWWDSGISLFGQDAMAAWGVKASAPTGVVKPEAPPVQVVGEAPVASELPKQQIGGDLSEEVQKGGVETQGTGQEEASTISSPLASTAEPAAVTGTASPAAAEPPSGISNERLQQIYGEDAVTVGKGLGAQEWQRIGQADTRDPYAAMSAAQARGIASPKDVALFRAEHQRLLNTARNAYGTPEYGELAQNSADMANAIKRVAHGPASDVFRALQDVDVPRYDSPADFDSIVRERMNRESTPDEHVTFRKISNELRNGDQEVIKTASEAQNNLRRYRPNEVISFDDAVAHIKEQIRSLTTDCNL